MTSVTLLNKSAFNHILREEARFTAERDRNTKPESGLAFYSSGKQRGQDGPRPKCDHCGKVGHIKSKCFELVGYPPNWDTRRTQRGSNKSGQSNAHLARVDENQGQEGLTTCHALCGIHGKDKAE